MAGKSRSLSTSVDSAEYYWNYHGQRTSHLKVVHEQLRSQGCKSIVWLAGDSSLDNKHWLFEGEKSDPTVMMRDEVAGPAVNGYQHILKPPRMARDVCYWINVELDKQRQATSQQQQVPQVAAINTAVEESILGERVDGQEPELLPQDIFIKDHVTEDDIIVIDVGGNDVALRPTMATALNMAALVYLSSTPIINNLSFAFAPSNGWYVGFPLGMGYFVNMFKNKLRIYIEKLIEKKKPKKVIVCMLYYLDQTPTGGWADGVLRTLGYDSNPAKLQAIIKRVFELGTSQIQIEGVEVVPFPLFKVLDGTDTTDYIERVEPSSKGGQKMAEALVPEILREPAK